MQRLVLMQINHRNEGDRRDAMDARSPASHLTAIKGARAARPQYEWPTEDQSMSYRQILVQVDEKASALSRAALAATVARTSGAQLVGVFLRSEFLQNFRTGEAIAYMPPYDIEALLKEHAAAVAQAGEQAREIFERAAGEAGVASEWRVVDGDSNAVLVACARRSDLAVFPTSATASCGQHVITAADLSLASGGPVLVVPNGYAAPQIGKRVLVAWKGTRESARALHDAWPLIAESEVHVVIVAREGEGGPEGLLQRHLEQHGRRPNLIVDRSDDASAADIIRRHAGALGADLIVMGLYGRSRLSELVLGGVSHDMLRDPPAPLLLSH
jgi:nucleotide-binding universal stress UspA family protein